MGQLFSYSFSAIAINSEQMDWELQHFGRKSFLTNYSVRRADTAQAIASQWFSQV